MNEVFRVAPRFREFRHDRCHGNHVEFWHNASLHHFTWLAIEASQAVKARHDLPFSLGTGHRFHAEMNRVDRPTCSNSPSNGNW